MIRYEYQMERVPLRSAGRPLEKLNELGSKGFNAVQAAQQGNDLVVLFVREIETKSVSAKKKEAPKKPTTKKDQQEIKDTTPVTKDEKEVTEELKAEE